VAELLDDRPEEVLRHRQIEQDTIRLSLLGQQLLEIGEGYSLRKTSGLSNARV
jgi:hypothetical protein